MWPLLGSQQPFSCVLGHFRHGDDNRPNKQPGYPSGQCEGSLLQLGFQTEFMITWLMRVMKQLEFINPQTDYTRLTTRCVYQRTRQPTTQLVMELLEGMLRWGRPAGFVCFLFVLSWGDAKVRIGALGYDVDGQLQTDCINYLRFYEHIFRSTSVESVTEEQLA